MMTKMEAMSYTSAKRNFGTLKWNSTNFVLEVNVILHKEILNQSSCDGRKLKKKIIDKYKTHYVLPPNTYRTVTQGYS